MQSIVSTFSHASDILCVFFENQAATRLSCRISQSPSSDRLVSTIKCFRCFYGFFTLVFLPRVCGFPEIFTMSKVSLHVRTFYGVVLRFYIRRCNVPSIRNELICAFMETPLTLKRSRYVVRVDRNVISYYVTRL